MAEKKSFLLRIDPGLWRELEGWAAAELRSVNGQVEFLLRDAVRRRRGAGASSSSGERPPEEAMRRRPSPGRAP
jgi:hypothetical protein